MCPISNNKNIDNIPVRAINLYMSFDEDIFFEESSTPLEIASDYAFQDKSSVFLFSNENVAGTMQILENIGGANVLSVAASGDSVFDAYLAGAKNVDTFDINSFQKLVMELKMHMIKHIDYYDFLSFFFSNSNFFEQDIIAPIEGKFSQPLKHFITKYKIHGRDLFKYRAAHHPDFNPFFNLNYLKTEQNYYKLRGILPDKINFKHCDLVNVSEKFNQRYDIILLSNIFDYMFNEHFSPQTRMQRMYYEILVPLARKNLSKDNGRICFQYLWEGNSPAWTSFLDFFERTQKANEAHTFATRSVNSAYGYNRRDIILIMRQNQKIK